jgi:hypothetical protein
MTTQAKFNQAMAAAAEQTHAALLLKYAPTSFDKAVVAVIERHQAAAQARRAS